MKKSFLAVTLLSMFMMIFAGCGGPAEPYKDGTYRAEDAQFSRGYKEFVEIIIQNGKITSVSSDALKENGQMLKTQDTAYKANYQGTGNDTTPDVYFPSLSAQLEKSKNVDKVQIVAGATSSSENFKRLAKAALEHAKNGSTEIAIVAAMDEEGMASRVDSSSR